ncbi:MAG: hypothetical protein D9N11_07700 [Ketobacter sp.]|nr:MAG: hypothetical protein D9N11_07700 [Ketobacter sp.]
MGKLADMVSEDLSFAEKMKINLRKIGLAGVGLASILDSERTKLYRQITELGEAYGGVDTVVGRISVLGTGTLNLVLEESQRLFDELVEEGEQALNRSKTPVEKPLPRKINQPRPVAKSKAPQKPVLRTPAKNSGDGKMASSDEALLTEALKQRLRVTSDRLRDLDLTPQQQLEVRAFTRQVESGDVKGRRPSKAKLNEQAEFDARRLLKGMKSEEAMKRLELLVQRLAAEAVS